MVESLTGKHPLKTPPSMDSPLVFTSPQSTNRRIIQTVFIMCPSFLFSFFREIRNHHFTAPKNITTKPEGILHPNGRKFTKFTQHHVNEGGGGNNEDEARYNLATRVMANGVEVIVADGKSTLPGEPNFFRILTNSKNYNRPLTLAPSTLNNVMMLMTLGGNPKVKVRRQISPKGRAKTRRNTNKLLLEYFPSFP